MPQPTQPLTQSEQLDAMDEASIAALATFPIDGTAREVLTWWANNYMRAGHKRLGQGLVKLKGK